MKKLLAILLALIMLLAFASCKKDELEENNDLSDIGGDEIYEAENGDKFTYTVNEEGDYDITGFSSKNNTPHKIEIPAEIDNVDVSGIGAEAFKANNQITEVVIPESVTRIDSLAFVECSYLTAISIPDSVKELGESVFRNCVALKSVKLSASLKVIPLATFMGCSALEEIEIPALVETIEEGAFMYTSLKSVTLPKSVKTVGNVAFYGNELLETAAVEGTELEFGKHVFNAGNDNFTVVADAESAAAKYADENGYKFTAAQ